MGTLTKIEITCPNCWGLGYIGKEQCGRCKGKGKIWIEVEVKDGTPPLPEN